MKNFIPKKDIVYSSDPYIEGLTEEEIAYFDKRFEEENETFNYRKLFEETEYGKGDYYGCGVYSIGR